MSPKAGDLLIREVAPRVHSLASSFTPIGCEDREELCQDAVVIAAALLVRSERRGKKVSPGNVSFFASKLVRQGRRSGGQSRTDVMAPATQISGRSRLTSLDEPIGETESDDVLCLHDVLAASSADPSEEAARRLDWKPLVDSLDANTRQVLLCLVSGVELTTLVSKLKRSRSALQSDKHRLARLVTEHLGNDILRLVQELPRWTDNLLASRERCACRAERQAA